MSESNPHRLWGLNLRPDALVAIVLWVHLLMPQSLGQSGGGQTIDLGVQAASVTIVGKGDNFELGTSTAVGDIDGDGKRDLAVGAAGGSGPGMTRPEAGEVQVFLGKNGFNSVLDTAAKGGDFVVYGRSPGDRLGDVASIALGDLNGDRIDDLVVGARTSNGPDGTRTSAGEVDVIFGRRGLSGVWDLSTQLPDVIVYGSEPLDWLGQRIIVGDLNKDTIADLVIAAPLADGPENGRESCGEVVVFYGNPRLSGAIDLSKQDSDLIIYGADVGDLLGSSLAIGDLNNDQLADLVVASVGGDGPGNSRGELTGEVNVIFGKASVGATIDLAAMSPEWVVYGKTREDIFGFATAVADVTGDGIGDLIVSASRADGPTNQRLSSGEVYVLSGSAKPIASYDLVKRSADLTIYGADRGDGLGLRLATFDVNGDKIADIFVSANGGDGPSNRRGEGTGEVYAIVAVRTSGGRTVPITGTFDLLSQRAYLTIYGSQKGQEFGYSLAVNDLSEDGVGDVAVGASNYSGADGQRVSAGCVYLVYGEK